MFEPVTKGHTKGVYRLLVLDSHGSHSSLEFNLFYKEHLIITLYILPHSSHLLQPLDVSCFSVLKHLYRQEIEQLIRAGCNHIDKPDFLSAYLIARKETMAINVIRNRFVGTGLVPYDPEQVLSKLNTQLRTPTPPPAPIEQQKWVPETPRNPADLEL